MTLKRLRSKARTLRWLASATRKVKSEFDIGYWTQFREFNRFRTQLGFQITPFFRTGLWDTRRSLKSRLATLSRRDRKILEYRMNPRRAEIFVRDKAVAAKTLIAAGLPVAPVLAIASLSEENESNSNSFPFIDTQAGVLELLASSPKNGVVFKPSKGGGGRSVYVFRSANSHRLIHFDGTPWSVEKLVAMMATEKVWKIETRLVQHETLSHVIGDAIGAVRLTTFLMNDGTVHLTLPVWKLPVGDSGLDHFGHGDGAAAAQIDSETGCIGPARYISGIDTIVQHPESGVDFVGIQIPFWQEVCDLAKSAARCFPESRSLGCDIAITPEGPVLIETNLHWSIDLHQVPWQQGLIQGEFVDFLAEVGSEDVINRQVRQIPVSAEV